MSCSACASMSAAIQCGLAFGGDDQNLGWPGDEIDADLAREQLLRGGDVDVARSDDAIGAWNRLRADRRTRRSRARRPSETQCRPPSSAAVPRISATGGGDVTQIVRHARHLRRNHRHHQRRGQRITARGNVGGDRIEWAHDLSEPQPGASVWRLRRGQLQLRVCADVRRTRARRACRNSGVSFAQPAAVRLAERARDCRSKSSNLRAYSSSGLVAALAHVLENRPHDGLGLGRSAPPCARAAGRLACDCQ